MKRLAAITAGLAGLGAAWFYGADSPPPRRHDQPPVASIPAQPISAAAALPVPASRVPSLRLTGVFVQQRGSTALLEVDGQPARAFREGDTVAGSWTLAQVRPEFVTVADAAQSMRVALAGGSAGADSRSLAPPAQAIRADPPPPVPVEVARERNRAFLEAVRARNAGS